MFLVASWDFGGIPLSLGKSLAVVRCLLLGLFFPQKQMRLSAVMVMCFAKLISYLY